MEGKKKDMEFELKILLHLILVFHLKLINKKIVLLTSVHTLKNKYL